MTGIERMIYKWFKPMILDGFKHIKYDGRRMRGKRFDSMITSMASDIACIDGGDDITRPAIMKVLYYEDPKRYDVDLSSLDMVAAYVANRWEDECDNKKKDGE